MDWNSFAIGMGVVSVLSLVVGLVEWRLFRQWDAARTELIAAQREYIDGADQLLGEIIKSHPSQELRDIWAMRANMPAHYRWQHVGDPRPRH